MADAILTRRGMDTSDATATASEILAGETAYVDGDLITGTIASKGAQTYIPGTSDQTIASGQYLSGVQTISGDTDLVAGNIKNGVNIFGVAGTAKVDASSYNSMSARSQSQTKTESYTFPSPVKLHSVVGLSLTGWHTGVNVTIAIQVGGSWITCDSSNGTYFTQLSGDSYNKIATWCNTGAYKDSAIQAVRAVITGAASDTNTQAFLFAVSAN